MEPIDKNYVKYEHQVKEPIPERVNVLNFCKDREEMMLTAATGQPHGRWVLK